jgi:hypothetical protein
MKSSASTIFISRSEKSQGVHRKFDSSVAVTVKHTTSLKMERITIHRISCLAPFPFNREKIPLSQLKKGDIIVREEAWENYDVYLMYKVLRINKKTISVIRCDQYGLEIRKYRRKLNIYHPHVEEDDNSEMKLNKLVL